MARDHTGIYAIENLKDQRAYVGATHRGFEARWAAHRSSLCRGCHQKPLQFDWDANGPGWFKFVVLEVLSPRAKMAHAEQSWIRRLTHDGYVCYNKSPVREWHPEKSYAGGVSSVNLARLADDTCAPVFYPLKDDPLC